MSQAAVQELENMGLLQSQAIIQWRAGEGEDYPFEGTLETVVFRDFVERGLTLSVSEFFHALLQLWGIQLHHLTPQSTLHLSIFTHFCEAFLGILPHFHLFQHFFILVPVPNATKLAVIGGCELILCPETRDEYLAYDPAGKGLEWKKFWFHVGNFESPLPERVPGAPLLALLKYPFYPQFNFDNGMNLISKSLTILTSAQLLVVFMFAHIFWRYFVFAGF